MNIASNSYHTNGVRYASNSTMMSQSLPSSSSWIRPSGMKSLVSERDEQNMLESLAPFPVKLFVLLTHNHGDVVYWLQHGLAFRVGNPKVFSAQIMPKYFKQSKIQSFLRQLNLYGFRRICKTEDQGAYFHPQFQREYPDRVLDIRRLPGKGNVPPINYEGFEDFVTSKLGFHVCDGELRGPAMHNNDMSSAAASRDRPLGDDVDFCGDIGDQNIDKALLDFLSGGDTDNIDGSNNPFLNDSNSSHSGFFYTQNQRPSILYSFNHGDLYNGAQPSSTGSSYRYSMDNNGSGLGNGANSFDGSTAGQKRPLLELMATMDNPQSHKINSSNFYQSNNISRQNNNNNSKGGYPTYLRPSLTQVTSKDPVTGGMRSMSKLTMNIGYDKILQQHQQQQQQQHQQQHQQQQQVRHCDGYTINNKGDKHITIDLHEPIDIMVVDPSMESDDPSTRRLQRVFSETNIRYAALKHVNEVQNSTGEPLIKVDNFVSVSLPVILRPADCERDPKALSSNDASGTTTNSVASDGSSDTCSPSAATADEVCTYSG